MTGRRESGLVAPFLLPVPAPYPNNFRNRQSIRITFDFRACHLMPDRVVAAIDEVVAAEANNGVK
jgi:hypothetical protein